MLGAAGMLGHKLCQVLGASFEVYGTFRNAVPDTPRIYENTIPIPGVDVSRGDSLGRAVATARPDVVVNAVGIVKQLALAKDAISSIQVNSLLPHVLARMGTDHGFRIVHISTDCVFSGRKGGYTEDDTPDPVDLYGRSKLLGELDGATALTLRTSIIGRELRTRNGLVEWFLSQRGGSVNGFARAIYTGLTTEALALTIVSVLRSEHPLHGLWHVSSPAISKYDLLRRLNVAFATGTEIVRDESVVCDRSLESARFWAMTGLGTPLWDDMIASMANDSTPYGSSTKC